MFSKDDSKRCKGVALLLLLFHHLFYNESRFTASGMKFVIIPYHPVQVIGVACRICVWMFVFISAYGLTVAYENSDHLGQNRFPFVRWVSLIGQYLPAFLVMCVLMTLVGVDIWHMLDAKVINVALDALALSDFFNTPSLCGVWWYMCLAQIIVVLIPLVCLYCDQVSVLPGMLLGYVIIQFAGDGIQSNSAGEYINYMLCVLFGCYSAKQDLFAKAISYFSESKMVRRLQLLLLVFDLAVLHAVIYKLKPIDVWHVRSLMQAIAAFTMCLIVILLSEEMPIVLSKALQLLGKHSGNIFLLHAFFYTYTPRLVYWSGMPIVSYLSLLALGLVSSCVLEWLKDKTGYARLIRGVLASARS